MGGTQHNQDVKCLKYLFEICSYHYYYYSFFIPVAYLNKCHLFSNAIVY